MLLGVEGTGAAAIDLSEVPERFRDAEVEAMQSSAWTHAAGSSPPAFPCWSSRAPTDQVTPPANGDELQASAPDRVSVVRIEDGGHLFAATHVGATSWAIEDYLDWD